MNDEWDAIHHEEVDADEPGSTGDPQHEGGEKKPSRTAGAKKSGLASEQAIGLTLALPQDMIDAMWGAADQWKRVALGLEENNALTRRLISLLTGGDDTDKSGSTGAG